MRTLDPVEALSDALNLLDDFNKHEHDLAGSSTVARDMGYTPADVPKMNELLQKTRASIYKNLRRQMEVFVAEVQK